VTSVTSVTLDPILQEPEFWGAQARLRFGTTRHVASGESGDLPPQSTRFSRYKIGLELG